MNIDFPVTIELFTVKVPIHPILEWFGIFLGMRLYVFLKRKQQNSLSTIQSLSIILGALLGALLGSKLIGTLENPQAFLTAQNPFLFFWTSNTIVGGLAFGLIGVELTKKIIHHKDSTGDLMVFPLILAIIIGRIGCFLTGVYEQTYGLPTQSIFGMYLGDEYLRHPVALYEIAFLILLGVGLIFFRRKFSYQSGFIFQLFMFSYFTFRFFLDFIKPKINLFLGLSMIQITCICAVFYYIFKLSKNKRSIQTQS